jgi:hypothetical protein
VYLEGWQPSFSRSTRYAAHHKPSGIVGMRSPHAAVSGFLLWCELPRQPVWSVTTALGTWTMRQDGLLCLTGATRLEAR